MSECWVTREIEGVVYSMRIGDFVFLSIDSDWYTPTIDAQDVSISATRFDNVLTCYSKANHELIEYDIQSYSVVDSPAIGEYIAIYNDKLDTNEDCLIVDSKTVDSKDVILYVSNSTFIAHSVKEF